ncbi:HAD family hydrolase [Microbacterium sp. NPDC058342]|uniref:HAD family hydrolase n=1 Tax=Microbacterium sp. NPDC058342 TaxID=3346454 RepID=UPI0036636511
MLAHLPLRAAIFDLDGTLIDQRVAQDAAAVAFAADHGIVADDVAERWHVIAHRHYRRYQTREITFEQQRCERVREFLGRDFSDADATEIFGAYLTRYEAGWQIYADAVPVLRRAREAGLVVALLTNGQQTQQFRKLERFALVSEIDVVLCSSELPAGKPDPRAYAAVLDRLGVAADEAVMIGDSIEADVQGALAAGLHAVHLARLGEEPVGHVHHAVSLDELRFAPAERTA